MIFDNLNESYLNEGEVKPSPYPLGLEGALMHVYENERNYCNMMKAVGISEAKYYAETGRDLFLNESGAFGSFLENAKKFFKKVWEKIKSIFKSLYAKIYSLVDDDKKFVKKYREQLQRVNLQDFEFEGYEFNIDDITIKWDKVDALVDRVKNIKISFVPQKGKDANTTYNSVANFNGNTLTATTSRVVYADADAVNKAKEEARGSLIDKGPMDESEFRDELKDSFYGNNGDKTTLENISIRQQLEIITNTENNIKVAKKMEKNATKWIDDVIKALDDKIKEVNKMSKAPAGDDQIRNINNVIDILRSTSNDVTIASGILVQAIKDCNRQAKAICVKALTYKVKESANYYSNGFSGSLLDDVELV